MPRAGPRCGPRSRQGGGWRRGCRALRPGRAGPGRGHGRASAGDGGRPAASSREGSGRPGRRDLILPGWQRRQARRVCAPIEPGPDLPPVRADVGHLETRRQPHVRQRRLASGVPSRGQQVSNAHRSAHPFPRRVQRGPAARMVTTSSPSRNRTRHLYSPGQMRKQPARAILTEKPPAQRGPPRTWRRTRKAPSTKPPSGGSPTPIMCGLLGERRAFVAAEADEFPGGVRVSLEDAESSQDAVSHR